MVKPHGNQNLCNKGTGHQSRYALYQNWCPVMANDSNFDRNPLRGCNYGSEGGAVLNLGGCNHGFRGCITLPVGTEINRRR